MGVRVRGKRRQRNRLTFDIENRPLSYWYDGQSTADVTVIAWKWETNHKADSVMQDQTTTTRDILEQFRPVIDRADVVVGHNIRQHDLSLLNAQYIIHGFAPLKPILTIDTLRDLPKWKDVPRSLEYLTDLLGCPLQKFHMTQHSWRTANALRDDSALALAKTRCEVDVLASEWVWKELEKRGLLTKQPRMWKP